MSFGDAPRLVSIDHILEPLLPFGFNERTLQLMLRRLHVPIVWLGDTQLVDLTVFQMAMCAVSMIGRPDFKSPVTNDRVTNTGGGFTNVGNGLDVQDFYRDWTQIYRSFIASKCAVGAGRNLDLDKIAQDAATRLMELGFDNQLRQKTAELLAEGAKELATARPELPQDAPGNPKPLP